MLLQTPFQRLETREEREGKGREGKGGEDSKGEKEIQYSKDVSKGKGM